MVQSVVCCQDSTLKPLVVPLYVIICPIICFEGIKFPWTWHGLMVKCGNTDKTTHPALWLTCKVLCPWALFLETTVVVQSQPNSSLHAKYYLCNKPWYHATEYMATQRALVKFYNFSLTRYKSQIQHSWCRWSSTVTGGGYIKCLLYAVKLNQWQVETVTAKSLYVAFPSTNSP